MEQSFSWIVIVWSSSRVSALKSPLYAKLTKKKSCRKTEKYLFQLFSDVQFLLFRMSTFFRTYPYLLDRAWFQRRPGFLDRLDLVSCFDDLSAPHRIGSRPVRNEKNQYDCFLRCRSDRPGVRVLPQLYYNRSFLCDHDGPAQQHQSDRREAGNDLAVSVRKDPDLGNDRVCARDTGCRLFI